MGRYRVRVATGAWLFSGSLNRVQLWLVGERGEAELGLRLRPARGQVRRGAGTPMPGGRAGPGGGARSSAHGAAGPPGAGRQAQRETDGARPGRGSSLPPRAWSLQPPLLSRVTPGRWHYGTWVQGDGAPRARAGRAQPADGAGDEAPGSTQDPGASPRAPRPLGAMGRRRPARRCWEEAAPALEASSPDSTKAPAPPADVPSWVPATECHGVLVPTGGGV